MHSAQQNDQITKLQYFNLYLSFFFYFSNEFIFNDSLLIKLINKLLT